MCKRTASLLFPSEATNSHHFLGTAGCTHRTLAQVTACGNFQVLVRHVKESLWQRTLQNEHVPAQKASQCRAVGSALKKAGHLQSGAGSLAKAAGGAEAEGQALPGQSMFMMALYNCVSTTKWTGRQEVRSWVAGLHVSQDRALYCSSTNLRTSDVVLESRGCGAR